MRGSALEVLFLSQSDILSAGVLDMKRCVESMEMVFQCHWRGDTYMNPRELHGAFMFWPKEPRGASVPTQGPDKKMCAMPAYVGGPYRMAGVKWYGSNGANPAKLGLPRSMHLITLNEAESGKPVAIMEGSLISAARTGGCAGLGAKYLAEEGASAVALVGAGVINRAALMAYGAVLPNLGEVWIYDLDHAKAESFAREMATAVPVEYHATSRLPDALRKADVISLATSGATAPRVEEALLKQGALIIPLGVMSTTEEVYSRARVVVDDHANFSQFVERRDPVLAPELLSLLERGKLVADRFDTLGQLVCGEAERGSSGAPWVICHTFGLPIEDVGWASALLQAARDQHLGQTLSLWSEPYWL